MSLYKNQIEVNRSSRFRPRTIEAKLEFWLSVDNISWKSKDQKIVWEKEPTWNYILASKETSESKYDKTKHDDKCCNKQRKICSKIDEITLFLLFFLKSDIKSCLINHQDTRNWFSRNGCEQLFSTVFGKFKCRNSFRFRDFGVFWKFLGVS